MKIVQIILFSLLFSNCKAQYPIIDIDDSRLGQPNGYYVKDIHNYLNQFEGTYLYTNGNTNFKIVLVKKVQQYNGRYYADMIIGEYQYILNGVEKVNTLSKIDTVYNDQRSHSINGNSVMNNNDKMWQCPECSAGEKRLMASIMDVSTSRFARIYMRRMVENGQEIMKVRIWNPTGEPYIEGQTPPPNFSLPLGVFTFVKQ